MSMRQRRTPAQSASRHRVTCSLQRSAISLGVSLSLAALLSAPVFAQTATADPSKDIPASGATELDTVTVTGVRGSVTKAQLIKQNAEQIVDSIVAEDIGKLPDDSVAEALQRITGVQISRDTKDAGNGIAIRGLTQVRTELNGRDIFTANNGRGLSWDDVPAELLAGVDVYKNPAADIIEGGLGGTVNLRTRMPFDFEGMKVAGSASYYNYDLADEGDQAFSGLFSNRWKVGDGELGILVNLSYQDGTFRQDSISVEPFRNQETAEGSGDFRWIPTGGGNATVFGDRTRKSGALALQWRPNDDVEAYLQVQRSDYDFQYRDYSFFAANGAANEIDIDWDTAQFNSNGEFVKGTFHNVYTESISSMATRHSVTTDYSAGVKWNFNENLKLSTDLQYIDATTDGLRYIVAMKLLDRPDGGGAPTFNLDLSSRLPQMSIVGPNGEADFLRNPANFGWFWNLDNIDTNEGDEWAWRGDLEYAFDNDEFARSFKAGVRYTDRSQINRGNVWRWLPIGNWGGANWGGHPILTTYPDATYQLNPFNDFYRGNANGFGPTIAPADQMVADYYGTSAMFGMDPLVYGPTNINNQNEKTYTGYGMLRFGLDDAALPFDGNLGVRVVRTEVQSIGVMTDPSGSGALLPLDIKRNYTDVLPSLNVRFLLQENLFWRVAVSRAMSRPGLDQLIPNLNLNVTRNPDGSLQNPTGTAGNPYLNPMRADQLDTAVEWYFGKGSMLYGTAFYKKVHDFFDTGVFNETYNGDVYQVTRPVNGEEGTVKGIELGYTQFFDFLPAPLDGFGVQANYTYVDSEAPSPSARDTDGTPLITPLPGLSKNSANAILMYEKGRFSARVAYNWRSDWLITTQGNGTGALPVYNKPLGWLDASFRFNLSDNWSISLDGQNLLDSEHETYMLNESRPRDFRINDRRYGVTLRFSL
ncbi:TonB-dependent receptor [Pseudoxanthomonas indica]|uniref:TonB-dependent receptor n=1 Tax=Pseudoxanthomonas indica TaxID=428993 RepID=A0A1T5K7Z9_9GAMM|nr:TonB-dependent receptor [Pseudoxanthomonas indica]SKC59598.1 TonB-dependent receptor [Pseudoxanthomonas indica]